MCRIQPERFFAYTEKLRKAERFDSFLDTDVDMSKSCSNISVLAFDFKQNLPLPHIPVGEIFYLRSCGSMCSEYIAL